MQVEPQSQGTRSSFLERRAFVRVPSTLEGRCRLAGRSHDVSWPGQVRDISRGGVGLVCQHRFRPGTQLEIEFRHADGRLLRTIAARVAHATPLFIDGRHAWLLGCAFDRPLDETEFETVAL
jgi:hypothetical protein